MNSDSNPETVAVLGLWHLGSVYSACFAKLGFNVIGLDTNKKSVESLRSGIPPVSEPGLKELLAKGLADGILSFSTDFGQLRSAEYVVLALDTPIDEEDRPNLKPLVKLCRKASPFLRKGTHVVVSSQVPVGTCERLAATLGLRNGMTISYVPENLRLGQAINSFLSPSFLVIGSDSSEGIRSTAKLFKGLGIEPVTMRLRAAEMVKHVLNSYLAMSIAFGNEMATLCRRVGVDPSEVVGAILNDSRISPKAPIRPGPPFSGGTLARDLTVLRNLGNRQKVQTFLLDGVARSNARRKEDIVKAALSAIGSWRGDSVVALLGLTYKAGTDTLRRSLALELANKLSRLGLRIHAYDPVVKHVPSIRGLSLFKDPYEAVSGADVILILTAWPEFTSLDLRRVVGTAKKPYVIDLTHVLDPKKVEDAGIKMIEV
jgi:UDPglucose 6-dehydrogenase